MLRPALLLTACLVLAGCGQSGPLYLPGNPSSVKSVPSQPNQSESQEQDGERPKSED